MHKFVRSLITEWRKLDLPFTSETIVVAVSGGADSIGLLLGIYDLLERKKLDLGVIVAHFNHKLRGRESDADEAFVRAFAQQYLKDFEVEHRQTIFVSGHGRGNFVGNLEEKARNERYRFLANVARKGGASFVLTAHTVNDQAETFLMNLIRGSGADGLAGMSPIRDLDGDGVILARPLLRWATRSDTESFCLDQAVMPRTDEMNADERFTRVRIRRTVIPELQRINPKIVEVLARTAQLIRDDAPRNCQQTPGGDLKLTDLRQMSKSELYGHLREWLRANRRGLRSVGLRHIEAISALIQSQKSGKTVELPGRGRVTKSNGRLVFRNIKVDK